MYIANGERGSTQVKQPPCSSPLSSPSHSTVTTTFSIFTGNGFLNFTVPLDLAPTANLVGAITANLGGSGATETTLENTCPVPCTARNTVNLKYTWRRAQRRWHRPLQDGTHVLHAIINPTCLAPSDLSPRVLAENAAFYCHGNTLSLALVDFLVHLHFFHFSQDLRKGSSTPQHKGK